MKRMVLTLCAVFLLLGLAATGDAQQSPAKGGDGPEVKQQPRTGERLDVRRKAKKKVAETDAPKSKGSDSTAVRRKAKRKVGVTDGRQPPNRVEGPEAKK